MNATIKNDEAIEKSIVGKIRKLLALADASKNSHENERNVAMQAALDLLAKHNLTMSEVKQASLDILPEEIRVNFKLEPWIREILGAACKLYYTDYYMSGERNLDGRIDRFPVFIGTAENIAVTVDMATWLIKSIRAESNKLYKDAHEKKSFRLGAADRIYDRAKAMTLAERNGAATTAGTSLIVLRNQYEKANQDHLSKKHLRPFKARAISLDYEAFATGENFGEQVGLSRQVSHQKSKPVHGLE